MYYSAVESIANFFLFVHKEWKDPRILMWLSILTLFCIKVDTKFATAIDLISSFVAKSTFRDEQ